MSGCLITHWSPSMVGTFQRNPLAFCKNYIAGIRDFKSGVSSLIGTAYDEALQSFFHAFKEGKTLPTLDEMIKTGMEVVYAIHPYNIKTGKTNPTVDSVFQEVAKKVPFVLKSFVDEVETYIDDIGEILFINKKFKEFVTLNGVDIPLPCVFVPDLVYRKKTEKLSVTDHKVVTAYTGQSAVIYNYTLQGCAYMVGMEKHLGETVEEFNFFENKSSKNSGGANAGLAQIQKIPIPLDSENRRMYELMLYEGVREVYHAAQDPDYTYLMNPHDKFMTDEEKGEMLNFWIAWKTQNVQEINPHISDEKAALLSKRKRKATDSSLCNISPVVIEKFKSKTNRFISYTPMEDQTPSQRIESRLATHGLPVSVEHTLNGYSSDTYLLELSNGRRIKEIFPFMLDIASVLKQESVRIAPNLKVFEGTSYVAIDANRGQADRKPLLWDKKNLEKGTMRIPMGIDNYGEDVVWDMNNPSTPHMLVCGATGSGKSVHLESIMKSVRALGGWSIEILDPKGDFNGSISEIEKIEERMQELVVEMNLAVMHKKQLNKLIVFDEFADALSSARTGKELNVYKDEIVGNYKDGSPKIKRVLASVNKSLSANLQILAQKGRSCGIRFIVATQRADVKAITGNIKVNFPVRICFYVPTAADSRVVLDEVGAESLSGMGDGLFRSPDYRDTVRFQGYFVEQ